MLAVSRLAANAFLSGNRIRRAKRHGRRGERLAARWLRRRGHRILARNLRWGRLEMDLLVESPDGRQAIVVEVKTGHGSVDRVLARVGRPQMRRLGMFARHIQPGRMVRGRPMRTDVVLVLLDRPRAQRVVHLRWDDV
ncbi:MAG: YraN family protein [Phycisphaerales bacterium]|nr:YraN family protein [Phycisphaerales bacterium]